MNRESDSEEIDIVGPGEKPAVKNEAKIMLEPANWTKVDEEGKIVILLNLITNSLQQAYTNFVEIQKNKLQIYRKFLDASDLNKFIGRVNAERKKNQQPLLTENEVDIVHGKQWKEALDGKKSQAPYDTKATSGAKETFLELADSLDPLMMDNRVKAMITASWAVFRRWKDDDARGKLAKDLKAAIDNPQYGIQSLKSDIFAEHRLWLLEIIFAYFSKADQRWKSSNFYNNYILLGDPGTGKTTLARVMAFVFGCMGVIANRNVVEIDSSSLLSEYQNASQQKVLIQVLRSLESVMFLDEAYMLASSRCQKQSSAPSSGLNLPFRKQTMQHLTSSLRDQELKRTRYLTPLAAVRAGGRSHEILALQQFKPAPRMGGEGKGKDSGVEATNQLMIVLDLYRSLFVFVAAGYPAEMQCWLETNRGLYRRLNDKIYVKPFTTEDISTLITFNLLLKKNEFNLSEETVRRKITKFVEQYRRSFRSGGGSTYQFLKYFWSSWSLLDVQNSSAFLKASSDSLFNETLEMLRGLVTRPLHPLTF